MVRSIGRACRACNVHKVNKTTRIKAPRKKRAQFCRLRETETNGDDDAKEQRCGVGVLQSLLDPPHHHRKQPSLGREPIPQHPLVAEATISLKKPQIQARPAHETNARAPLLCTTFSAPKISVYLSICCSGEHFASGPTHGARPPQRLALQRRTGAALKTKIGTPLVQRYSTSVSLKYFNSRH